MFLYCSNLIPEFVNLFGHAFEVHLLLVEHVETSVDLSQLVMDRPEFRLDHSGYFLADNFPCDLTNVVLGQHPVLDEIDGLKDVFGILVHRSSAYHTSDG